MHEWRWALRFGLSLFFVAHLSGAETPEDKAAPKNPVPSSNVTATNEAGAAPASLDETYLYPEGLVSFPDNDRFSQHIFIVGKKERTLWVLQRDQDHFKLVDKFETDIGKNEGEKEKANDFKTPTGIYFLQHKMTQPEIPFSLYGSIAFPTDYPNIFDRADAKSGSGIWLHAVPDSVPMTRGSRGCVVVRNKAIQKIAPLVKATQTPLVIYNSVKFLTQVEHQKLRQKYLDFFEKWRSSWETQDVSSYMKFYDQSFRSDSNMDFRKWERHKQKLKKLYSEIHVDLSTPLIIWNKDQVVMRTIQHYRSNLHEDIGEKTIHARATPNDGDFGFKIIREDWVPTPPPATASSTTQASH